MTVKFKELEKKPFQYLSLDDEYLPFALKIGKVNTLPETIYARNIYEETFIEFRFDKDTNHLYEITLVSLQPNVALTVDSILLKQLNKGFFCCMIENINELDISKPIQIYRSVDTFEIKWSERDLIYFSVSENCTLGIDNNNELSAVILSSLNEKQIEQIG